ncbi:MAG: hypothetical protein IH892_03620 [Planctomycetes bacterium]|nr:hypothetical protein [Planctomycetota bacterium]
MHKTGYFDHSESEIPKIDTSVIVKTQKGLQLGSIVGTSTCYSGGKCSCTCGKANDYYEASDTTTRVESLGKFVRFATPEDLREEAHLKKLAKDEIGTSQRIAGGMGLSMKIVDAEHIIGGERIIFYFMAESRVDFRELVKKLSYEFQTRIEMHQVGARDEARIVGDVASCGQEQCCKRFLKDLNPVSMRMAKTQKVSLAKDRLLGMCGRIKCCFRYEDKTYTELQKSLPRNNSRVMTPDGPGKVLETQALTQLAIVLLDNGERVPWGIEHLSEAPAQVAVAAPATAGPSRVPARAGEPTRGGGKDRTNRADRSPRQARDGQGGQERGRRQGRGGRSDRKGPGHRGDSAPQGTRPSGTTREGKAQRDSGSQPLGGSPGDVSGDPQGSP